MTTPLTNLQFIQALGSIHPNDILTVLCPEQYYFQGTIETITFDGTNLSITFGNNNLLTSDYGWEHPSTNEPFVVLVGLISDIKIEDGNLQFSIGTTNETVTIIKRVVINPEMFFVAQETRNDFNPYDEIQS